ncbi:hypothetical protein [Kitasatospora sp. NPDC047058]|uniref:hypothetical protein n=1 Tax=Kitasatospora sp. NPDC047058 TaxID=3155620 RepID=UPI0033F38F35
MQGVRGGGVLARGVRGGGARGAGAGGRSDEGSTAIFVAICAAFLVLVIALVVDAGGRLRVAERTDAYAQEAARVAGQQLDEAAVLRGEGYKVQEKFLRDAADSYLALYHLKAADVTFSSDRTVVTVTVKAEYKPALLGELGKQKVTGQGSATLVHGVKKAETD